VNDEKVLQIVMESGIDENLVRFIVHRYGIGLERYMSIVELSKLYKIRGKRLNEKISKADKIIFNILKKQNIYDIIDQK
jgi:hypothetical protein